MKQTKTGFVRSLPDDYSIDQVIAALDKAGFSKTSRENAFSLRHNAKKRKPKSNGHAATAPRAAAPSATTRTMTASDFIRAQPLTMDTGEVTKAAHAAGYPAVTRKYVGSVRWRYKEPEAPAPTPAQADAAPAAQETVPIAAPPQPPPLPSPPPPMPAPVPEPEPLPATAVTVRRSNAEWRRLFVECVCELGTSQSSRLLGEVEELIASCAIEAIDQTAQDA